MSRTELIDTLSGLTEKQFVELFYEIANNRRDQTEYDKSHWTLVEARLIETLHKVGKRSQTWYTEFLCVANPVEYPDGWADDVPICQNGTCHNCGYDFISYAKEAICAVCGGNVGGT